MAWLFQVSRRNSDGSVTIPADSVDRWERQVQTPYSELSEREKQSDREEVARILPIIKEYMALGRDLSEVCDLCKIPYKRSRRSFA